MSTKNVSFFLVNNEKINSSHEDIIRYKESIKDIAGHVCYYCQMLHFIYQTFVALKSYIEKFPHELKNALTMQDILICKSCKKKFNLENTFDFFQKLGPLLPGIF